MADEAKKSVPPEERRVALARKLTGGQRIPNAPSSAPESRRAPPSSDPVPVSKAPSGREAVLASRREAIVDARSPGAPRPVESVPPKPAPERKIGPGVLALLAVVAVVALVAAGFWAKSALYASSPEGKVRDTLVTWELSPNAGREAVFAELDQLGPAALPFVIQFLGDASVAERGDSHSTRPVREIAHLYLMRLAKNLKVAAPKEADEVAKSLFLGSLPPDAQWAGSQQAWRAWLEAQQAKGTIAKP